MKKYDYVLATPCKNEEASLSALAESVVNQTITPKLWVIVDDGSTDKSSEILKDLEIKHSWIKVLTCNETKRDLSFHYAKIVDTGLTFAVDFCKQHELYFAYIGLIDADMILEKNFFKKMIDRFENNPKLGVASGSTVYYDSDQLITETGRDNLPIGGLRLWRRKCFFETGGFPITYSADSVSNVLAILSGWDLKKFDDIVGVQTRRTSSSGGLWGGYGIKGESDYYRDYHPLYVMLKVIKYIFTYPFYIGIAYLYGYIKAIYTIREKINIPQVRNYYRNKHLEIFRYYAGKFKINP